jgi:hypothetical protein
LSIGSGEKLVKKTCCLAKFNLCRYSPAPSAELAAAAAPAAAAAAAVFQAVGGGLYKLNQVDP